MAEICLIKEWMTPNVHFTMREKGALLYAVLETNAAMKLLIF